MMDEITRKPCTAFVGLRLLRSGTLADVALAVKSAAEHAGDDAILVFDDRSGRVIDLDLRGSADEVIARLATHPLAGHQPVPVQQEESAPTARGKGRPRLGVIGREVTLLPRHWEWLAAQPGGASVALRKLVEAARRTDEGASDARAAQAVAYQFLSALAGDLPDYEEVSRALFSGDTAAFEQRMAAAEWPADIRTYAARLARGGA